MQTDQVKVKEIDKLIETNLIAFPGQIIDLEQIEKDPWIHVLTRGKYSHSNGPIVLNNKTLGQYLENYENKIIEWELSINYNHEHQEAAGWIMDLEIREEGLFALVEWTDNGIADLKANRYKYISSEISQVFRHPKSGKITRYVYMGAALTNIPHLMDITPIEMERKSVPDEGKSELTVDELLKTMGVNTLSEAIAMFNKKEDTTDKDRIAKLEEENKEKDKLIASLAKQEFKNTIETHLSNWSKGDKFSLPAITLTKLGDFIQELDANDVTKLAAVIDELLTIGLVEPEDGASHVVDLSDKSDKSAMTKFTGLIADIQKEKKCSYNSAFELAKIQNPKLAEKYLEEQRNDA